MMLPLKQDNEPQLVNTAHLTDADWVEINKIDQAYTQRSLTGFVKALDALYKRDQLRWLKVVWAYYPKMVSDAVSANPTFSGVRVEDIFGKLARAPTKH